MRSSASRAESSKYFQQCMAASICWMRWWLWGARSSSSARRARRSPRRIGCRSTRPLPQRPINPYGESKLIFEDPALVREIGVKFVALRYFNAISAWSATAEPPRRVAPHPERPGRSGRRSTSRSMARTTRRRTERACALSAVDWRDAHAGARGHGERVLQSRHRRRTTCGGRRCAARSSRPIKVVEAAPARRPRGSSPARTRSSASWAGRRNFNRSIGSSRARGPGTSSIRSDTWTDWERRLSSADGKQPLQSEVSTTFRRAK